MVIIEKNEGAKITYTAKDNKITFGDDELMLNLEKFERDDTNHIDICRDKYDNLVTGVVPGLAETYAAQIDIPAREYEFAQGGEDEDGNPMQTKTSLPFDMKKCTLTLWALV